MDRRSLSTGLLSGSKAPGKAPTIHPPWNKARVGPTDDGGRKRGGPQERRRGRGVGLFESGEAGMRESREGSRGREMRNGARNGERREHRGALPGLSTNHHLSLVGGALINGSYFHTSVGTGEPSPAKQKLSEALGLISGARRLRGAARVGGEDCSGARGWHGGGRPCSRTHGSVSAWVSQRDADSAGRRGGDSSESEVWWTRGKLGPSSDSETGSAASSSESSGSVESSTSAPLTSRTEATESGPETEKQDWETVEEETADTQLGRQSRLEAELETESGLEWQLRSKFSDNVTSGNSGSGEGGNRSATLRQESAETNAKSVAAPPRPPTPRSSQDTTEEEGEEDEEVRNVLSLTLANSSSGLTKDLSPIIEDKEEEEDKGEDEGAGDWGKQPAD